MSAHIDIDHVELTRRIVVAELDAKHSRQAHQEAQMRTFELSERCGELTAELRVAADHIRSLFVHALSEELWVDRNLSEPWQSARAWAVRNGAR